LIQAIYAEHPDYPIPQAPQGQGLLVTRSSGLMAEDEPPILYASVGNGCLVHPLSDPSFPSPQPIGNDLVVPPGNHTLTLHADPPLDEIPTCDDKPIAQAPISVAAGDRFLAFPYRLPGTTAMSLMLMPFGDE
jgi:hypothetical protein